MLGLEGCTSVAVLVVDIVKPFSYAIERKAWRQKQRSIGETRVEKC